MILLNAKEISTIQRALGLIEGIAFATEEKISTGLFTAVEMITDIIDDQELQMPQRSDTE